MTVRLENGICGEADDVAEIGKVSMVTFEDENGNMIEDVGVVVEIF